MNKRNQGIPKTNLYNQLDIARWDTVNRVSAQMDMDLYWSSYYMITDKVYSVIPVSIDEACIRGIMRRL